MENNYSWLPNAKVLKANCTSGLRQNILPQ